MSGWLGEPRARGKAWKWVAIALNPIGAALSTTKGGSKLLSVVAPHHHLLLKSAGQTYRQQVEQVRAPAGAELTQRVRAGETTAPKPEALPMPATSSTPWAVGMVVLAGVILLGATYWTRRSR